MIPVTHVKSMVSELVAGLAILSGIVRKLIAKKTEPVWLMAIGSYM
jgi:hypothetical protein